MNLRVALDNYFCKYSLGGIWSDSVKPDNYLQENGQDYVVFGVPQSLKFRFTPFWEKVREELGHRFERYLVQECIPLEDGYILEVTLYFLPVKSAELLLLHFERLASEVFDSAVAEV